MTAALGAVILGEYDLQGTTVIVGFPLLRVGDTELALAVGKRLTPLTLPAVGAVAAGGLTWSLWISFGHFRNGYLPPGLSWAMVGAPALAAEVHAPCCTPTPSGVGVVGAREMSGRC